MRTSDTSAMRIIGDLRKVRGETVSIPLESASCMRVSRRGLFAFFPVSHSIHRLAIYRRAFAVNGWSEALFLVSTTHRTFSCSLTLGLHDPS